MAIKIDREAWYDTSEHAALRGVATKTLEQQRYQGGGVPFSRIGRKVFYLGADIEDFLMKGRRASNSARLIQLSRPLPEARDGEEA